VTDNNLASTAEISHSIDSTVSSPSETAQSMVVVVLKWNEITFPQILYNNG